MEVEGFEYQAEVCRDLRGLLRGVGVEREIGVKLIFMKNDLDPCVTAVW